MFFASLRIFGENFEHAARVNPSSWRGLRKFFGGTVHLVHFVARDVASPLSIRPPCGRSPYSKVPVSSGVSSTSTSMNDAEDRSRFPQGPGPTTPGSGPTSRENPSARGFRRQLWGCVLVLGAGTALAAFVMGTMSAILSPGPRKG